MGREVTNTSVPSGSADAAGPRRRRLSDAARGGLWEIDADCVSTWASPCLCGMLGYQPEELAARPLRDFLDPETASGIPPALDLDAALELRLVRKDGARLWVRLTPDPEEDAASTAGRTRRLFSVTDIDHRKLGSRERDARAGRNRLSIPIQDAPVAIGMISGGRSLFFNEAFLRLFGMDSPADYEGQPIAERIGREHRDAASRLFAGPGTENRESEEFETVALRADGSAFPCRVVLTGFEPEQGPATLAFFFDMSSRNDAEHRLEASRTELRNLANHLLHAREEERKKVAREIHDELGQILTALKMDLQWLEKRPAGRAAQEADKIRGLVQLADQTIQMVHRIASELRPAVLDDLGLAPALEWLGGDFSRRNSIPCSVDIGTIEPRIDEKSATALFRIIQEALINVSRHARASRASVELWEEATVLRVRVTDDGVGITEGQAASGSSIGLIGIRERVQGMRGEMSIKGRPGVGTVLSLAIPVTPRKEAP